MANIKMPCIFPGGKVIKSTRFTWPNSNYPPKGPVGNLNIRSEFAGCLPQFIVMQVRVREIFCKQTKTRYYSIPAPAFMFDTDDIDHKGITWLRSLNIYRSSKRVNEVEV